MSRPHDADDSYSHFEAAAAAYTAPTSHDPFSPVIGHGQAQPAPVYASPSFVPAADLGLALEQDQDVPFLRTRKRSVALRAAAGAALLAGALLIANHFRSEGQAEERRLAEIAQVQRTMAELAEKRRAEEASRAQDRAPAAPSSTVAALLAASTNSYGAAQSPQAAKPNSLAAAREAAAIQRALRGPSAGRPGRVAQGPKTPRGKRDDAREEEDSLQENRSNDPIYGL